MTTKSVTDQLREDLTSAMKERDPIATSTLRMLRAAIMNASVAGKEAVELSDDEVIGVLAAEAKKRVEAAEIYEANGRLEAAGTERAELVIIERYLPTPLTDSELSAMVDDEIAAVARAGVEGAKAMGQVIKSVRDRAGARADGGRIASLVKAQLL